MTPGEVCAASETICSALRQTPVFVTAHNAAAFAALAGEPDLGALWRVSRSSGIVGPDIHLPRVDGERLVFSAVSHGTTVSGRFGILEPEPGAPETDPCRLDFILVPGLAFTREGGRLGRGGGYYDRWLCSLARRAPAVGVAFDCQIVPELPVEEHDVILDAVLTESGWVKPLHLQSRRS